MLFCSSEDVLEHGFLYCLFVEQFWGWIVYNFGVSISCSSFSELLASFSSSHFTLLKDLLSALSIFGCSIIWISRCHVFYDGVSLWVQDLNSSLRDLLSLCSIKKILFTLSFLFPVTYPSCLVNNTVVPFCGCNGVFHYLSPISWTLMVLLFFILNTLGMALLFDRRMAQFFMLFLIILARGPVLVQSCWLCWKIWGSVANYLSIRL